MNNVYKNKGFFEVDIKGANFILLSDRRNIEKMMIEDIDAFILQLKTNAAMLKGKITNDMYYYSNSAAGLTFSHDLVLNLISSEMEPFKLEYGVVSTKNENLKHYDYLGRFISIDEKTYEGECIDYISRVASDKKKYTLCLDL